MRNFIKTDALKLFTENNWLCFSDNERIAIYSMLGNMVNADGAATPEELFYLEQCRIYLKLTEEEKFAADWGSADLLLVIIADMTREKKNATLLLLNEVIIVDKPITEREKWFLGALCVNCQLL